MKGLLVVGGCLLLVTSVRIVLLMYGAITAGNSLHTSMLLALLRAPMRFFDRQGTAPTTPQARRLWYPSSHPLT